MRATLFVDASFDQRCGAAGWGSWMIRDGWTRGRFEGGPVEFKDQPVRNSTVAELAGIAYALWRHDKLGNLEGLSNIMIQCDNVDALGLILTNVPNVRPRASGKVTIGRVTSTHPTVPTILKTIRGIVKGRSIEVKHVKGHNGATTDGRSWVNEQCDRIAKGHMRDLRTKFRTRDCATISDVG